MTASLLPASNLFVEALRLFVIAGLSALLGALVVTYVMRREQPAAMWYGGICAALLLSEDIIEHIGRFVDNSWPTWHLPFSFAVIVFGFMAIHRRTRKEEHP